MLGVLATAGNLCFNEQSVEIERARKHFNSAIDSPRPLVARPVPVKLDPVFIGIAQIERFAHAVVRRAIELNTCAEKTLERVGEFRARRVEDRHVIQPGCPVRRRRASAALPRIEPDVMVIATGRDECRLASVALRQLEAEDTAIKSQRAFEVGDL